MMRLVTHIHLVFEPKCTRDTNDDFVRAILQALVLISTVQLCKQIATFAFCDFPKRSSPDPVSTDAAGCSGVWCVSTSPTQMGVCEPGAGSEQPLVNLYVRIAFTRLCGLRAVTNRRSYANCHVTAGSRCCFQTLRRCAAPCAIAKP